MHPLVRALLIMVGGGIILITPTIGVMASHRYLPFRGTLNPSAADYQSDYNLQCVARSFALLTAMWVTGVFFYHLIEVVPAAVLRVWRMFKGKRNIEKLKDRLHFFVAIKLYIKMIVMAAASLVCFVIMFPNASYRFTGKVAGGSASWDQVLFQINVMMLFACAIIAVEKLILKVIATRFHRSAYKERLEQQRYASWVLDHLNRSREGGGAAAASSGPYANAGAAMFPGGSSSSIGDAQSSRKDLLGASPSAAEGAAPRGPADLKTPPPLDTRTSSSFWQHPPFGARRGTNEKKPQRGIASRLWNIRDMAMDGGVDMNSNQYAGRLARKLFNALHNDRDYLVVDDFLPFFDKEEDAIKAFELFDKDNNGDISRREMRDRVLMIYKERRLLLNDLSDMSQVVGKLDIFLTAFSLIIIIIIALMVFGLDALKTLATLGTMFVAWSFVFGTTFKNIFECIIFLFQVHPYDVGDTVVVATENLTVSKIRLLSTVFFKTDGTYTVYPNSVLGTMKIQNLRRSKPQSENIPVAFNFDTPLDKIQALRERMDAYAEERPRDLIAPVGYSVDLLENVNRIQVSVGINYKNNWQDGARRGKIKLEFSIELREAIRELGLRYAMPLQPVAMVPSPPGYDEATDNAPPSTRRQPTAGRNGDDDDDDDSIFGPQSAGHQPDTHAQVPAAGYGAGHGGYHGGGAGGSSAAGPAAAGGMMTAGSMLATGIL
ncbi:hypothetical protein H4R21_000714 [Coemansia helicoidea]|uniref:Uncharacterized protein n=1 Tax=Coemansia helicoidea TaxID=1286919 RepID=A0ACC1LFP0_9FUNG|nr:hypothetical protein H4R21_000714 [Coemansia helicoidea]